MPAFNDLFWPEQIWPGYGGTRGNPALKPETGWYGDAGLSFEKTEPFYFQAELAFFENRMENLIDWQSDADFVFAPVNVGKARIHGVESRVSFKTPGGRLQASISPCWMRSLDKSVSSGDGGAGGEDRFLPYRPEWKIDADAGFSLKALHFEFRHQTVGRRFTTADNGKALPAYPLWSAGASFRRRFGAFTANTRFQVNNLADRRISNMDGYPLPGREYRISFEMHY
jgi:vitamin B12 transporter